MEQDSHTFPFDDMINLTMSVMHKREAMIEYVMEENNNLNEELAKQQADSILMPKFKKSLKVTFTIFIIGMTKKRAPFLMKAIMKKGREYTKEGFGERAEIETAVSYSLYGSCVTRVRAN